MPGRSFEEGSCVSQRERAPAGTPTSWGQRGANAHPTAGVSRDGGLPGIARSGASSLSSRRGRESSSPRV